VKCAVWLFSSPTSEMVSVERFVPNFYQKIVQKYFNSLFWIMWSLISFLIRFYQIHSSNECISIFNWKNKMNKFLTFHVH
jgi:hypothetical protein